MDTGSKAPRRTRTGCIGCRLRRKKCTGEKPACAGCVRNSILCTWPRSGDEAQARLLSRSNPAIHEEDGAAIPSRTHILQASEILLSSDMEPIELMQLNVASPWLARTNSRRLFHHFITCTSKTLALGLSQEDSFLAEIMPLAMQNSPILNSLLACAGTHLSGLSRTKLDSETLFYYGQAIQGQKAALTYLCNDNHKFLVPALVTAVILCIVEVKTIREKTARATRLTCSADNPGRVRQPGSLPSQGRSGAATKSA